MDAQDETASSKNGCPCVIGWGKIAWLFVLALALLLLYFLIRHYILSFPSWLLVLSPLIIVSVFLGLHKLGGWVASRFFRKDVWPDFSWTSSILSLLIAGLSLAGVHTLLDVNDRLRSMIEDENPEKIVGLLHYMDFSRHFQDGSTMLTVATRREGESLNKQESFSGGMVSTWFMSIVGAGQSSLRLHEKFTGKDVLALSLANPILFDYIASVYKATKQLPSHELAGNDYHSNRNLFHFAFADENIAPGVLEIVVQKIKAKFPKLDPNQADESGYTPLSLLFDNQRHRENLISKSAGKDGSGEIEAYCNAIVIMLSGKGTDMSKKFLEGQLGKKSSTNWDANIRTLIQCLPLASMEERSHEL